MTFALDVAVVGGDDDEFVGCAAGLDVELDEPHAASNTTAPATTNPKPRIFTRSTLTGDLSVLVRFSRRNEDIRSPTASGSR
jgi:hypothetical protein